MKQIELNLKKRLLIVEENKVDLNTLESLESSFIALSKGSVKLICKGSELTEEIAIELVPQKMNVFIPQFWNYKDREDLFYAKESVISAIEAQGYYWGENPIEKPIKYSFFKSEQFNEKEDEFKDAQSRTFNPEKTLIFEILL